MGGLFLAQIRSTLASRKGSSWCNLFPNGNGRHARLAKEVLLTKVLKVSAFSWGQDNLVEAGETRQRYIHALKSADQHDYQPLLAFVRS